jgi:hypothetical protein
MEWRITLTVRKRKAVKEFLLGIEAIKSMLGQDVRIEQWDRKELRDAEIRRWWGGGSGGWARWRWDGKSWFREKEKGNDQLHQTYLRPAGAGWAWRPARRGGYEDPSKLRYAEKAPLRRKARRYAAKRRK